MKPRKSIPLSPEEHEAFRVRMLSASHGDIKSTQSKLEIEALTGLKVAFEIGEELYVTDQRVVTGLTKLIVYSTCCAQRHNYEHIVYLFENGEHAGESYCFKTLIEAEDNIKEQKAFRDKWYNSESGNRLPD